MAGKPGRSGRRPSEALQMIRNLVNDPQCLRAARERARKDPVFWFQLYQQIHGRPAQAVTLSGSLGLNELISAIPLVAANGDTTGDAHTNGHT